MTEETLLTVDDVAKILRVNPWQVRLYIKKGKLIASKLGNGSGDSGNYRYRIWRKDLMAFINKSRNVND
ncbi:hypothetical protein LCGC14_3047810 [marine sediment metagenome]|uniref:Helix-turn-helix domain-containing protein n=1 Tax=marine sediment metagenome TaxID=412755 RepID=A0A0F8XAU5_9ZZZZ